jgi:hypothetical protein
MLRVNTKTGSTQFINFNALSEPGDRYRGAVEVNGFVYVMRTQKKHVDSVVRIAAVNLADNSVEMIEERTTARRASSKRGNRMNLNQGPLRRSARVAMKTALQAEKAKELAVQAAAEAAAARERKDEALYRKQYLKFIASRVVELHSNNTYEELLIAAENAKQIGEADASVAILKLAAMKKKELQQQNDPSYKQQIKAELERRAKHARSLGEEDAAIAIEELMRGGYKKKSRKTRRLRLK